MNRPFEWPICTVCGKRVRCSTDDRHPYHGNRNKCQNCWFKINKECSSKKGETKCNCVSKNFEAEIVSLRAKVDELEFELTTNLYELKEYLSWIKESKAY